MHGIERVEESGGQFNASLGIANGRTWLWHPQVYSSTPGPYLATIGLSGSSGLGFSVEPLPLPTTR